MLVKDLGLMPYRDAWAEQERAHASVVAGGPEQLLLVEHPPVITLGRRGELSRSHILASDQQLREMGVEVVQSDRGGDVTFHGPGQLVAYPIIRLKDHGLSVGGYVRKLQETVVLALKEFGIEGRLDPGVVGVWVLSAGRLAKICAVGVRIRQGVSLHGIALNSETQLSYFEAITPCGLVGKPVTSMRSLLGAAMPTSGQLKAALVHQMRKALMLECPEQRRRP